MTRRSPLVARRSKQPRDQIAVVVSQFNHEITNNLLQHCLQTLKKYGMAQNQIRVVWVPGAYEIPLTAKRLAKTKRFNAVIALGAIVKGQTPHNHYLAHAVAQGLMQASLETNTPIIFGVITPNTWKQAILRSNGGRLDKGIESARCALEMIQLLKSVHERRAPSPESRS